MPHLANPSPWAGGCAMIAAELATALPAQSTAVMPRMRADQALQLMDQAGFRIQDGKTVNRCGQPANPRIAFADLNGDGRAEAHVADVGPGCYGRPGAYFAILGQDDAGQWKRLIAEDGIVGFAAARTSGWNDLTLAAGDSACPGTRRFNGSSYDSVSACAPQEATKAAPTSTAPVSATLSRERLVDELTGQTDKARGMLISDRDRLFRAAGLQYMPDGRWTRCTEDDSGGSQGFVALYDDLNGDGRPEAVVRDDGTFCNGHSGAGSLVLSQRPDGSWTKLYENQGYVSFLTSRGTDNFPDIEAGVPGLCFPYFRWDGQKYQLIAKLDNDGQECEPF